MTDKDLRETYMRIGLMGKPAEIKYQRLAQIEAENPRSRHFGIWRHFTMEGHQTDYKCCLTGHLCAADAVICREGDRLSWRGLDYVGCATGDYWED